MTEPAPPRQSVRRVLAPDARRFFAPRTVRLVTRKERCPKCDAYVLRRNLQAGWMFETCERRRCEFEWWSMAIPPDAPAGYLASLLGEILARPLLLRLWPKSAATEVPELWGYEINPGDDRAWVQIAVLPSERWLYANAKLQQIVAALLTDTPPTSSAA